MSTVPARVKTSMKALRLLCIPVVALSVACSAASAAVAPAPAVIEHRAILTPRSMALRGDRRPVVPTIVFSHGNVDWLPELAAAAGWPESTWPRLSHIILRESGGCPGRIGGSKVDKNCNIIGWDGSHHKSDSGLLQINGLNWDSKRIGRPSFLEKEFGINTQEPLLDPFINLVAGKAMYDIYGWSPWYVRP